MITFSKYKKSEFKQSFPAGLYEAPAHTLFWVGWSETQYKLLTERIKRNKRFIYGPTVYC